MRPVIAAILLGAFGVLAPAPVAAQEIVVDNDQGAPGYAQTGEWTLSASVGWNGTTYVHTDLSKPLSTATWRPNIPTSGFYEVAALILKSTNRTPRAPYTINFAGGSAVVEASQVGSSIAMGEVPLGVHYFNAGTAGSVTLSNTGDAGAYIADAMAFRPAQPVGPTIDQIAREPKFVEPAQAVTLRCRITPAGGLTVTAAAVGVELLPSGSTLTLPLVDNGTNGDTTAGDGVYAAIVPAQPGGTTVRFTFTATDSNGLSTLSDTNSYSVLAPPANEWRCIWVDTWNASFRNAAEAQDLVNTCRANNINTIIIEVRKIGDAYYSSALEPRATNITGGSSFDPLGYLLQLAHDTSGGKKRVQVHAWFVSHRISRGETLAPTHILSRHPEYEMLRSDGSTLTTNRYLDPGHPGAVDHNVAVILDCLSKYDIDGINLDYIRYPESTGTWGYNPVSVQRFNTLNGRSGSPAGTDEAWRAWRRECVTLQVRKGYVKSWRMRPHVVYTACTVNWGSNYTEATWPSSDAYRAVFQDWVGWLREGIIDYNAMMNYTPLTSVARYEGWSNLSFANDSRRGSIIGIGAYLHTNVAGSMEQLLWARHNGGGLNIYDWGSEVQGNTSGENRTAFFNALRTQVFPTWVDPPQPAWKHNPTTGIFEGTVTHNGQPVDHAAVEIVGLPGSATVTDGSGWFGILDVPPGAHTVRASRTGLPTRNAAASIPVAGDVITVDIALDASGVEGWAGY